MAKAKTASLPKGDKSFTKVDKKAFDPTLASLFAASVRFPVCESRCTICLLTHSAVRTSAGPSQV